MALDIGRIAYQAYINHIDQSKISEFVHAPWEALQKADCDAWRESALAVSKYLDQCKKDMEDKIIDKS